MNQLEYKLDALKRSRYINAPEDVIIRELCEKIGYGAVMDAAMRLWIRKDPNGAFYIGGCVGLTKEELLEHGKNNI
jgi:hypothetical protein